MRFSGKVKEHLVTALEVPRDLAFRETIITVTGPNRVLIENYKSISKLAQEEIVILCIHGRVHLQGKRMKVVHYTPYEMLVDGVISEILLKR